MMATQSTNQMINLIATHALQTQFVPRQSRKLNTNRSKLIPVDSCRHWEEICKRVVLVRIMLGE